MILFHGSTMVIETPKLLDSQRLLDFVKGFHTTSNQEQAERWAKLKRRRSIENTKAIVSKYFLDDEVITRSNINTKIFEKADEEWLDFVLANRMDLVKFNYDIVIDPVANDTLYATLTLFETGLLTKNETIVRLKSHKLFDQISFHTNLALAEIQYQDFYECIADE